MRDARLRGRLPPSPRRAARGAGRRSRCACAAAGQPRRRASPRPGRAGDSRLLDAATISREVARGTRGRSRQLNDLRLPTARRAAPRRAARARSGLGATISPAQLLEVGGGLLAASKPARPISSERSALRALSLNVRPMAITSPTDFICVVSVASASGNFSKAKRGILVTHVVDRRLEAGRRLARDVVRELVERVADGELGGDLGDGKPVALRRQRATSATRAGSSR